MTDTIEIFCCYAREDRDLFQQLEKHLSQLQRDDRRITLWNDGHIAPGMNWEEEIDRHLDKAQIILLLISPAFLASDYCYSIGMKHALARHNSGEARTIPIILRPVHWQDTPLGSLQTLPINAKPITAWRDLDEAFFDVAQGVSRTIESLKLSATLASSATLAIKEATRPFHEQLRFERELRGWTQKELTDLLDLPDSRIVVRWENGLAVPRSYYRRSLARFFDMSVEELGLTGQPSQQLPEEPVSPSDHSQEMDTVGISMSVMLRAWIPSQIREAKIELVMSKLLSEWYPLLLGRLYLTFNRNNAALSIYEKALANEPMSPALSIGKGEALLSLNRPDEALAAYAQAISLAPDSSAAYKGKGRAYEQLAQQVFEETMRQARQSYEKAEQLGVE